MSGKPLQFREILYNTMDVNTRIPCFVRGCEVGKAVRLGYRVGK